MENKHNITRNIALLLAIMMSAGALSACGKKPSDDSISTKELTDDASGPADSGEKYTFPALDMKGDNFTILNTSQTYGFYSTLDLQSETGDTLDDAVYKRNRSLEDRYKFKLEVVEAKLDEAANLLQTSVLANDDLYDVAFIRDYYMSTAITEGYLQNLDDIPEFQLDCEWWDTEAINAARIGDKKKALFALTDVSLVDFEGTMVTFFNENMMTDLGLDLPYQLVSDGKWTFDKMCEYMKAGTSLNGDDSFVLTNEGKCIYGMASFQQSITSLICGANINFIQTNAENYPEIGLTGDKFYTYFDKIKNAFTVEGEYIYANDKGLPTYEDIFKDGRSLLMMGQLKAANNYRDMEYTYGILPTPKYEESQDDYRNLRTFACMMCIPVTNKRLHETGAIIDAMSYITYTDIMPYFYEGRLSQKMLRTDESIAMFEIIRETRCFEFGLAYGWVDPIYTAFHNVVTSNGAIASKLASTLPSIEASIDKVMNKIDG